MEDQLAIDFSSEKVRKGWRETNLRKDDADIVCRQLECARDEVRCRELMQKATRDEVVIALDNLRLLLMRERKNP